MADLDRFLEAQSHGIYEDALAEIRNGRKERHWMWFIFPQLKGLGSSAVADFYGIADLAEAREYLAHPVLGERLREISEALLGLEEDDPQKILGWPDCLKLRSCMTLFDLLESGKVFVKILDRFYDGKRDKKTFELLNNF